jgi:hypothetical protein
VAASIGGQYSPVHAIEKMEGGFSKALLLHKENGTEIIAKIPFPIAGSPRYTTASEVAVLQYCETAMPAIPYYLPVTNEFAGFSAYTYSSPSSSGFSLGC